MGGSSGARRCEYIRGTHGLFNALSIERFLYFSIAGGDVKTMVSEPRHSALALARQV